MELFEYIKPLRKWWWLVAVATLVAAVSSVLATLQQPTLYQASSSLMIGSIFNNPNPNGSEFWLGQQLATTYVEISKGEAVRRATMERLGLPGWLPQYTVRQVPNTLLIEISVIDSSPERATAVADELADQLILRSPTATQQGDAQRQAFIQEQLTDLESQIKATQAEIVARQTALGELVSARQIADTQAQIAGLQSKLNSLQANYAGLLANTSAGAINTLNVVERAADRTPVQVGSGRLFTILTAAAIGFVLAAAAAYLLEYLDDTVKSPDDVEKLTKLPTLAGIMRIAGESDPDRLITIKEPRSNTAEAYRSLRTGVQFATVEGDNRSLLITSPNPGDGKTVTAGNLALVFAQAGKRVVLVDADLRRPKQHKLFGLSNQAGLSTLFMRLDPNSSAAEQEAALDEALQPSMDNNLQILTSGPLPPNPSELLGSQRMRQILEALHRRCDLVIFDTPPLLVVTDALVLSGHAQNVLLVAQVQKTRDGALQRAAALLREANVHALGVVLNLLPRDGRGYYYYYYYYRDYYYSAPAEGEGGRAQGERRRKRRSQGGAWQRLVNSLRGS